MSATAERKPALPASASPQISETPAELPNLQRDLVLSTGDGAAYGLMVGMGETYFSAFALALGLGEVYAGLLASVPILLGSLLQLVSPGGVRWLRSHRRWVICCAVLQTTCFVPLIIAAWTGSIGHAALMIVASLYWSASLGSSPAWNTWMGAVVPASQRATFFARRSRVNQAATFLGFLGAGLALQGGKWSGERTVELVFVGVFLVALICRLTSMICLYLQRELPPETKSLRDLSSRVIISRMFTGDSGRFLMFAVLMQAGVYLAGPYFSPYMLKLLRLQYWEFAVLLGVSFVTKFLTLPYWGQYAHRVGAQRLLWIGAIGIVPLSAGWLVSSNLWYLMVLQSVAGTTWAAYELALFLLFFETIPARERTGILTWYNLANSAALAFGSLLGGGLLWALGVTESAYLWVFACSSLLRGATVLFIVRLPRIEVEVQPMPVRPLTVRPSSGSMDSPILPAMPDQQTAASEVDEAFAEAVLTPPQRVKSA